MTDEERSLLEKQLEQRKPGLLQEVPKLQQQYQRPQEVVTLPELAKGLVQSTIPGTTPKAQGQSWLPKLLPTPPPQFQGSDMDQVRQTMEWQKAHPEASANPGYLGQELSKGLGLIVGGATMGQPEALSEVAAGRPIQQNLNTALSRAKTVEPGITNPFEGMHPNPNYQGFIEDYKAISPRPDRSAFDIREIAKSKAPIERPSTVPDLRSTPEYKKWIQDSYAKEKSLMQGAGKETEPSLSRMPPHADTQEGLRNTIEKDVGGQTYTVGEKDLTPKGLLRSERKRGVSTQDSKRLYAEEKAAKAEAKEAGETWKEPETRGRPPIGEKPMTGAERVAKSRAKASTLKEDIAQSKMKKGPGTGEGPGAMKTPEPPSNTTAAKFKRDQDTMKRKAQLASGKPFEPDTTQGPISTAEAYKQASEGMSMKTMKAQKDIKARRLEEEKIKAAREQVIGEDRYRDIQKGIKGDIAQSRTQVGNPKKNTMGFTTSENKNWHPINTPTPQHNSLDIAEGDYIRVGEGKNAFEGKVVESTKLPTEPRTEPVTKVVVEKYDGSRTELTMTGSEIWEIDGEQPITTVLGKPREGWADISKYSKRQIKGKEEGMTAKASTIKGDIKASQTKAPKTTTYRTSKGNLTIEHNPEKMEFRVLNEEGKEVGSYEVEPQEGGFKGINITVSPEYQRQGVATELRRLAEKEYGEWLGTGSNMSEEGMAFSESRLPGSIKGDVNKLKKERTQ